MFFSDPKTTGGKYGGHPTHTYQRHGGRIHFRYLLHGVRMRALFHTRLQGRRLPYPGKRRLHAAYILLWRPRGLSEDTNERHLLPMEQDLRSRHQSGSHHQASTAGQG